MIPLYIGVYRYHHKFINKQKHTITFALSLTALKLQYPVSDD